MNGKSKCKILKDIRRQIAADNDIEFVTSECKYQGDCTGTCPKCEAEVRYLEQELAKRQKAGKAVAVAGIAATILVSTAGCLPSTTMGDMQPVASSSSTQQEVPGGILAPTEPLEPMGAMAPAPTGDKVPEPTTMGEPTPATEATEPPLMGVPVDPDLWD
jgi:hypothetical protein